MPELIWAPGKNQWIAKWTENGKPKERVFPVTSVRTMSEARTFFDDLTKKFTVAA